jgi:hypothetical protein
VPGWATPRIATQRWSVPSGTSTTVPTRTTRGGCRLRADRVLRRGGREPPSVGRTARRGAHDPCRCRCHRSGVPRNHGIYLARLGIPCRAGQRWRGSRSPRPRSRGWLTCPRGDCADSSKPSAISSRRARTCPRSGRTLTGRRRWLAPNCADHRVRRDSAGPLVDAVLPVYAEVYAEPPYDEGPDDVRDFAASWERASPHRGFASHFATEDQGEVVEFAFGHHLTRDTHWWDGALTALPAEATERPERAFAVIEMAVREPQRRRGGRPAPSRRSAGWYSRGSSHAADTPRSRASAKGVRLLGIRQDRPDPAVAPRSGV